MKPTPIEISRESGSFRTVAIIDGDEIEIQGQYGSDATGWESDIESCVTISRAALDRLIELVYPNRNAVPETKP